MYADQSLHLMMSSKFFPTIQFNKRHANMSNNNIAHNGVIMFMINDVLALLRAKSLVYRMTNCILNSGNETKQRNVGSEEH